jgi:hypothetical protein
MRIRSNRITVISFGFMRRIRCKQGATVGEVLLKLFKSELKGYFISVNGIKATRNTLIKDKDIIVAIISVRGAATLKRSGKVWRYYKNDADVNFPSNFHAHNVENGELLDLFTGYVYDPKTRKPLGVIPRKDMLAIYSKLKRSKDDIIAAKCDDDPAKFTYLN